ncbi:MAG: RNA-guided endonuclease InsQ/TnpB family protein [Paraclostridium sp.]
MKTVKKLKITIVNDNEEQRKEQYKFIRDSQYAQYLALNTGISILSNGFFAGDRDLKSEEYKKAKKSITNSNKLFKHISYGKGLDTLSLVTQKVKKDFEASVKNGLAIGERSVTNYKRTYPLLTRGRDLAFSYDENNEVLISWVGKSLYGKSITFKVILGHKGMNSQELMHSLNKIIEGQNLLKELDKEIDKDIKKAKTKSLLEHIYVVGESRISFDKKNRLMIDLTIDMPEPDKVNFVKGRVLGVDLGINCPAYICLSDDTYKRSYIGNKQELFKQKSQYKARYERTQQQLKNVKGGKGRAKKLSNINRLSGCERNFTKTYNHTISKRIVDFAKDSNCEYIHLEKLTKDGFGEIILRNWSYYELQSMIEYKAKRLGIKVRYVNPAYTSQMCSSCGYTDKENRKTQDKFICTNCGFGETHGFKTKDKKIYVNADHNAAINIARSKDFISGDDLGV